METVDVVVIGGGVIGLAIAKALGALGRDVIVIEQHGRLGNETSSRNSEVIHAGLYYPAGSLKARTALRGKKLLYRYCNARGIKFERCGKLVVAVTDDEAPALTHLLENAKACGVDDLEIVSGDRLKQMAPELHAKAALWSPSSGVVDTHSLLLQLETEILDQGGTIALNTQALRLTQQAPFITIELQNKPSAPYSLQARWVINAAGHNAHALSATLANARQHCPQIYWGKGHYFDYTGPVPFKHLIYPLPSPGALGIHFTRSTDGACRFGPDLTWVAEPDYRFEHDDGRRHQTFAKSIQRYWPDLEPHKLLPGTVGIRPKLAGPGQSNADFAVQGPRDHGIDGYIALYGIESPGLTASLAIAEHVTSLMQ